MAYTNFYKRSNVQNIYRMQSKSTFHMQVEWKMLVVFLELIELFFVIDFF